MFRVVLHLVMTSSLDAFSKRVVPSGEILGLASMILVDGSGKEYSLDMYAGSSTRAVKIEGSNTQDGYPENGISDSK